MILIIINIILKNNNKNKNILNKKFVICIFFDLRKYVYNKLCYYYNYLIMQLNIRLIY